MASPQPGREQVKRDDNQETEKGNEKIIADTETTYECTMSKHDRPQPPASL